MTTTSFIACGLAVYLGAADLIDATSVKGYDLSAIPGESFESTFRDASSWAFATEKSASLEAIPVAAEPSQVLEAIVSEIADFNELSEGWDGEMAAKPKAKAIREALRFVRASGEYATWFQPALHVDGSILLELDDGLMGSLRFRGDGIVICAIENHAPQVVPFNGYEIPAAIEAMLALPEGSHMSMPL